MAIPMNRFTAPVANFCESGAVVLNGNSMAARVAKAMIHPKKPNGRGVVSSSTWMRLWPRARPRLRWQCRPPTVWWRRLPGGRSFPHPYP